jgi:hypothetical protein
MPQTPLKIPVERVLGRVWGPNPGPTLICVGGIHGNEPAGVLALRHVLKSLDARQERISGEFVALTGNRTPLAEKRRFVDRDLNRAWTSARLAKLRNGGSDGVTVEDTEQTELLAILGQVTNDARGPVYFVDLHTTSGHGGTFSTFGDSLPNRAFAQAIPFPMVLGLEELLPGTLLGFLGEHGLVSIGVETGQHDEAQAVDRARAVIWIAIRASGLLPAGDVPEAEAAHRMLRDEADGLPRALEMLHKYDMVPGCDFEMLPGYENFQVVRKDEVVAHDRDGEVTISEDGRLLMPLYQEQGDDGYFLVREFSPFWLRISYWLRRMRADRIALLLPGVRRDPSDEDLLIVDKRVARWYSLQLFHLLGYRGDRAAGEQLVVRRRRFDEVRFMSRGPTPEQLK